MFPYESPNFQQDIDEVWEMIRPLYEELHAYIRRKLRDLYGPEKIGGHSPLPSHILGKSNVLASKQRYEVPKSSLWNSTLNNLQNLIKIIAYNWKYRYYII